MKRRKRPQRASAALVVAHTVAVALVTLSTFVLRACTHFFHCLQGLKIQRKLGKEKCTWFSTGGGG